MPISICGFHKYNPEIPIEQQLKGSEEIYIKYDSEDKTITRFLSEMEKYAPDILTQCERAIEDAQSDADFIRLDEAAFKACREDSIDYAVAL